MSRPDLSPPAALPRPTGASPLPTALRRIVAAGAWWVPRSRRPAWRREWEAELAHAAADRNRLRPPRTLLRRALWSYLDAVLIFKEELTMTRLLADLRLAVRSLQRSRTFTAVAVLTLALGIGANTAIFSVVNSVLIEPLPYPESDRLLSINFTAPGLGYDVVPFSDDFFVYMRDHQQALDALGMYSRDSVNLVGEGDPVRVAGGNLTPSVFDALRVPAALGRTLVPADAEPGAEPVAVIAYTLWQGRFGGDPEILGRTEDMDGVMRRIVGVMPEGFQFPDAQTRVWKPLIIDTATLNPGNFSYPGIGRMAAGRTLESVTADIEAMMTALFADSTDQYPPALIEQAAFATRIVDAKEVVVGNVRQALLVVLGTVGLVLLIACANVANLFLVRAETRQREVTLRAALGAGRGDIARFFLAESLILSLTGGALGALLATAAVRAFASLAPVAIPRLDEIGINARVLAFTLVLSILTGLLFGVVPMLRRHLRDLAGSLREGGRSIAGRQGRFSARNLLVVAQVALALVLLVGSGLMMRSFQALRTVDPGFDAQGALAVQIALPSREFPDAAQRLTFWQSLRDRAAALPGVTAAGAIDNEPLGGGRSAGSFAIEEFPTDDASLPPLAEKKRVLPGYFEALHIPLIEGRYLTDADGAGQFRAVVVSENLARHWWPQESALGKRVRNSNNEEWYEIVGVVGNVHHTSLEEAPEETLYMPALFGPEESPQASASMTLLLDSTGDPTALAGPVRAILRKLAPRVPVARSASMESLLSDSMARTSFTLVMLAIAAAAALLLGAVGIYGVVSYVVNQRTAEIGVRIALGASRGSVQGMVVRRGMLLTLAGIAVGVIGALAASTTLGSLLYEVDAVDPITYGGVALALAATALIASWLPARRASGLDPVVALRSD